MELFWQAWGSIDTSCSLLKSTSLIVVSQVCPIALQGSIHIYIFYIYICMFTYIYICMCAHTHIYIYTSSCDFKRFLFWFILIQRYQKDRNKVHDPCVSAIYTFDLPKSIGLNKSTCNKCDSMILLCLMRDMRLAQNLSFNKSITKHFRYQKWIVLTYISCM